MGRGPNFTIIEGDWQALTYIINDLSSRIIDEDRSFTDYLLADGSRELSANWDAGAYEIKAATLTDGILSINSGSITGGVDGTFTGTVEADVLTVPFGTVVIDSSGIDLTAVPIVVTDEDVTARQFIIGENALGTSEWGYLDGQDQSVKTTSGPTFADVSVAANGYFGWGGNEYIKATSTTLRFYTGDILRAELGSTGFNMQGNAITNVTNTNWDAAYTHIGESGASHTYIDQDVTTAGTPSFLTLTSTIFYASGDPDTYINFEVDDRFFFVAGGVEMMKFVEVALGQDYIVINENGVDLDFRVEGVGQTHALFVQGSDGYVGINNSAPTAALDVIGAASIGDDTNDLLISSTGVVTMTGTAKRALTLRAEMDYAAQIAAEKPTQVTIGIAKGYSFPIWNDGVNADEQMFFRENVPGRWDGESDIIIHVKVALGGVEDVGDKFNLEWAWEHSPAEEPVPATSNSVPVETTVLAGRAAEYDEYTVEFTIDHDIDGAGNEIQTHELLNGRLRRLAASASEVANEPIALDWHTYYIVDKTFKEPE